jgi:ABC-2 type transport system ATP-binding protein
MSISVNSLTKLYAKQKAIDAISFTTRPGKVTGFLGPNGAGKSTTMKILTGFIPQTSGTATVCGFDVVTQSREVRRHVGYLPETNPQYLEMYVKESLAFIAEVHQVHNPAKRIAEVIEQTGLGPEQHKKIGQLSKGYRQRVGLAQAIIHDPQVLILDEPTSGLDPNQLVGIRQLIRDLGATKTIILSTHIMQEVDAVCDDVIIINQGKIVAGNSLQGIKDEHKGKSIEQIFISLTSGLA